MNQHYRAMFSAMMLVAGLLGFALERMMPTNIAAPLAVWIAFLWGKSADQIGDRFKTDVERILEPEKNLALLMHISRIIVVGMAIISCLGPILGAPLAACCGVAILGLLVIKWF